LWGGPVLRSTVEVEQEEAERDEARREASQREVERMVRGGWPGAGPFRFFGGGWGNDR
jgi:hypothetical protein